MNILEKLEKFRTQLNSFMPNLNEPKLRKALNKVKHFKDKNRSIKLNETELKLFRFLVMNDYKPDTVYKWLLFVSCPEELKKEYVEGRLSCREVISSNKFDSNLNNDFIIDEIDWCYECFFVDGGDEK